MHKAFFLGLRGRLAPGSNKSVGAHISTIMMSGHIGFFGQNCLAEIITDASPALFERDIINSEKEKIVLVEASSKFVNGILQFNSFSLYSI